ncbi:hypothetical protein QBC44DRAFT_386603, partial [Cladorrhinum sp. PSN332]
MMAAAPDLKGMFPPTAKRHRSGPFGGYPSLIKDSFTLSTLLLIGALIQTLLTLILPTRYAVLPLVLLLTRALALTIHQTRNLGSYHTAQGIIPGRLSAQLPLPSCTSSESTTPYGSKPASQPLVVFHLGARFQHPLGPLSPGAKEFGQVFTSLNRQLLRSAKKYGCIDLSLWKGQDRASISTILGIYYFKDVEGLNKFAHDPAHRKAWDWFNAFKASGLEGGKHLGIFHETFEVKSGGWETIYVDMQPVLLGGGSLSVSNEEDDDKEEWVRTLVDAGKEWRGSMGTQFARMGRGRDGKEPEDARLEIAKTIFETGALNGGQLTKGFANASLNSSSLTTALATTIKEGWALASLGVRITPLESVIEYIMAPANVINSPKTNALGEYINITIRVCTSTFPAPDAMKDNLSHRETLFSHRDDPSSPQPVRLPSGQTLGDFALWTRSSVSWVLGNDSFVTVTRAINNPTFSKTSPSGSTPQPPGPGARVTTVATDLNRYLQQGLVGDLTKQKKPSPTLAPGTPKPVTVKTWGDFTVKTWGDFTVQVDNVSEAHPIRAGEDPNGLVDLIRPGTKGGKFQFRARKTAGDSSITLRFADTNTLVFSELKVDVKVTV